MSNLVIRFRNVEERDQCDLTRIGNVAAVSGDGLTVKLEDVDLDDWKDTSDEPIEEAALRAGMAACGVWVKFGEGGDDQSD